jgi:hypothetical protein
MPAQIRQTPATREDNECPRRENKCRGRNDECGPRVQLILSARDRTQRPGSGNGDRLSIR